ncbi:MAG: hypothetical protein WC310_04460 [Patescibacteria group bacterium]|jgi:hypothetical protein
MRKIKDFRKNKGQKKITAKMKNCFIINGIIDDQDKINLLDKKNDGRKTKIVEEKIIKTLIRKNIEIFRMASFVGNIIARL